MSQGDLAIALAALAPSHVAQVLVSLLLLLLLLRAAACACASGEPNVRARRRQADCFCSLCAAAEAPLASAPRPLSTSKCGCKAQQADQRASHHSTYRPLLAPRRCRCYRRCAAAACVTSAPASCPWPRPVALHRKPAV
jgi:hypothetical protein